MTVRFEDYPFEIRPLAPEEGGGFLITLPDLPGCMSDGETVEEAIDHGRDAFACWMAAHVEDGREIPLPRQESLVVRMEQRLPRAMRSRLDFLAKKEGIPLNRLVMDLLEEGLGKRTGA